VHGRRTRKNPTSSPLSPVDQGGERVGFFMDENKFDEPMKFWPQKHGLPGLHFPSSVLHYYLVKIYII